MLKNALSHILCLSILLGLAGCPRASSSNDTPALHWPQWRYGPGRGAATPMELPESLHLQWVRHLPQPTPAWPASQPALRFDVSYSPVATDKLLLVPSMVRDSVTAYDIATGKEQWRFYTDGPVRFAPIAYRGKVYFGSDDGYLYCLDQDKGKLQWRFRGGPKERNLLGNERLISTWPVRGGPVLYKGKIYFTAGIWPFMGIFVHAVDAQTGTAVWSNSGAGSTYTVQPHNSPAFAGLAPRGHLAATDRGLVIPGGRTRPGCYDLETGAFRYFHFGGKGSGHHHVMAADDWYIVNGTLVQMEAGQDLLPTPATVHDGTALYSRVGPNIVAHAWPPVSEVIETKGARGQTVKKTQWRLDEQWQRSAADCPERLFLKAGSHLVAGSKDTVALLDVTSQDTARVVWKGTFQGEPWTMLAAGKRLFVVTVEGRIYCFGAKKSRAKQYKLPEPEVTPSPKQPTAQKLVEATGARAGYCVMLGLDEALAEALIQETDLHLIAVDSDAKKVDAFRRRMDRAGRYGTRIVAHVGDPATFSLPPYPASLVLADDFVTADADRKASLLKVIFETLRPYGGAACLRVSAEKLRAMVKQVKLEGAKVKPLGKTASLLIRDGALPGAADWTHNYADAANSVTSTDRRVKLPLGLLWFGGPPNDEVLPRHGHGPAPQVAAGRLVIEGRHMLRALDIYTGRLLWQKQLADLGRFYDIIEHQPGAGEIGSNYVSLEDAVYVVYRQDILKLDAGTGEEIGKFSLDATEEVPNPRWGYLGAHDDLLVATSTPILAEPAPGAGPADPESAYLIKPNEPWQYLAGSDPVGEWTSADFVAEGWKTAPAGFGYGDDDDQTMLDDMKDNYTRVYLRKDFDAKAAGGTAAATLMINYDDAFIAYLNGQEIARVGVQNGSGPQTGTIASHEAAGHEAFAIAQFGQLLRPGKNILAIEGHNILPTSSDFTLDPHLTIKKAQSPAIKKTRKPIAQILKPTEYSSASRRLVVFDRHSGKPLWQHDASYGFRHNSIALGAGKLFCIDGMSQNKLQQLQRRGRQIPDYRPRLLALDLRTGKEVWSTDQNVFGTFLSYSAEHDIVLQAGSKARDRADDESGTGMVAYRGADGNLLWQELGRQFNGPCVLHHDTIICQGETEGPAFSLLTGQPKMRKHPLTGQPIPWLFTRNYGCNTATASEHLLTFRSAAAGFYDLARDGGTGNFGGFRSSCTSNLVVAGGLLNAPEYTNTCGCSYQNQTSLAMVHDPSAEVWTFNSLAWDGQPVRRVGINFGAPGDRLADDGTLWLDYPSTGGPSPDLTINMAPDHIQYFRVHSGQIEAESDIPQLPWVVASGAENVQSVTLRLATDDGNPRRYTVRLHFAELRDLKPGQRVFDVLLQGKKVLERFDIAKESGGTNRAVVKEFPNIAVESRLQVELKPVDPNSSAQPILCGLEAVMNTE